MQEKIGKVFRIFADDVEPVDEVRAGDIAAVLGLKNTATGDTLLGASHPPHSVFTLDGVPLPQPGYPTSHNFIPHPLVLEYSFIRKC